MPLPQIKVTKRKDGREVAWFRDTQGRVGTSKGMIFSGSLAATAQRWVTADQLRQLAEYGIQLQKEQCAAGLGSDGSPMPPLKQAKLSFGSRSGKVVQFNRKTLRDLYGKGDDHGHMLDAIRINYLDDKQATIAITDTRNRQKAKGNEMRSPWWGWSPLSVQKLTARAAEIFGTGMAEYLITVGLIGANAVAGLNTRVVSSGGTSRRAA
ncbi:MAG TPA: hypothetical protein VGH38_14150 [Bryobacteraceae bacterium]|jgi:hypothetical protein